MPSRLTHQIAGYQLVIDLDPAPETGVLGLNSFLREGYPEILGIPAAIPKTPEGRLVGPHCGQALTLGPSYKEADGSWVPLAGVPAEWGDIEVQTVADTAELAEFEIEYRIGGGPTLWEHYRLSSGGLYYETRLQWVVGGFRLQCPLFVTDGKNVGISHAQGRRVTLGMAGQQMMLDSGDDDQRWQLEPETYANQLAVYQNAFLQQRSAVSFRADIRIGSESGPESA